MSSNPLYGLRKVGTFVQLTGAAWTTAAPACVCMLHTVAVRSTALVSDDKRIRGVYTRRCTIRIIIFLQCTLLPWITPQIRFITIPTMHRPVQKFQYAFGSMMRIATEYTKVAIPSTVRWYHAILLLIIQTYMHGPMSRTKCYRLCVLHWSCG